MTPQRMFELAQALGEAKNRQNVEDALTFMHPDIVLSSPAWGLIARGHAENAEVLRHFFHDYPDYTVIFDGHVADAEALVGWGTVRMTMSGQASDARGLKPNGRRIKIPVYIRMTFKDDLIATEDFMCDLAQICAQSGLSVDRVYRNIFGVDLAA
jgi:predicted ester cyclase